MVRSETSRFGTLAIVATMIFAGLFAGCLSNEWPPCLGEGTGYFRSEVISIDPPGYHTPNKRDLPYVSVGSQIEATVEPPECGGPPEYYVWEFRGGEDFDQFSREYRTPGENVRLTVPYVGRYYLEPSFVNPDDQRILNSDALYVRAKYHFESDLQTEGVETNFTTFCCPWRGKLNLTSEGVGPEADWTVRVLVDRTDEVIVEETVPTGHKGLIAQEGHFRNVLGDK